MNRGGNNIHNKFEQGPRPGYNLPNNRKRTSSFTRNALPTAPKRSSNTNPSCLGPAQTLNKFRSSGAKNDVYMPFTPRRDNVGTSPTNKQTISATTTLTRQKNIYNHFPLQDLADRIVESRERRENAILRMFNSSPKKSIEASTAMQVDQDGGFNINRKRDSYDIEHLINHSVPPGQDPTVPISISDIKQQLHHKILALLKESKVQFELVNEYIYPALQSSTNICLVSQKIQFPQLLILMTNFLYLSVDRGGSDCVWLVCRDPIATYLKFHYYNDGTIVTHTPIHKQERDPSLFIISPKELPILKKPVKIIWFDCYKAEDYEKIEQTSKLAPILLLSSKSFNDYILGSLRSTVETIKFEDTQSTWCDISITYVPCDSSAGKEGSLDTKIKFVLQNYQLTFHTPMVTHGKGNTDKIAGLFKKHNTTITKVDDDSLSHRLKRDNKPFITSKYSLVKKAKTIILIAPDSNAYKFKNYVKSENSNDQRIIVLMTSHDFKIGNQYFEFCSDGHMEVSQEIKDYFEKKEKTNRKPKKVKDPVPVNGKEQGKLKRTKTKRKWHGKTKKEG